MSFPPTTMSEANTPNSFHNFYLIYSIDHRRLAWLMALHE